MNYHTWSSEDIPGLGVQQIPLILSWAVTIHKAQGITLDTCIADVGHNIFEYGQIRPVNSEIDPNSPCE